MSKEIQKLKKSASKIKKLKPHLNLITTGFFLVAVVLQVFSHAPLNAAPITAVGCAACLMSYFNQSQAKLHLALIERIESLEEKLEVEKGDA
jgi:hypothetical protein